MNGRFPGVPLANARSTPGYVRSPLRGCKERRNFKTHASGSCWRHSGNDHKRNVLFFPCWCPNGRRLFVVLGQGGAGASAGECETVRSAAIMNQATRRSILRWIHLMMSIPIIGYAYSPFEELPNHAAVVRFFAVPVIALTGLLMWKGHVVGRLISNRPPVTAVTE